MALLEGEREITSLAGVTLTNQRVLGGANVGGSTQHLSICLGEVTSCSLTTKHYPLLVVFAALSLIGFVFEWAPRTGAFVLAVVFGIAYFWTRRVVLRVASRGGDAIEKKVVGSGGQQYSDFLSSVDREKLGVGSVG
jgi:hypothetical protein